MGWKMEPCPRCGGSKAIVAKLCRKCHGETTNSPTCPSCGGKKSYDSKLCRACQAGQGKSHKPCPDCGKRIQSANTRCRECYDKTRELKHYFCIDCGVRTRRYSSTSHAERCGPCERKRRRIPRGDDRCLVPDCLQPHAAKGFCQGHYRAVFRPERTGSRNTNLKRALSRWPCQICGYSRMVSDVHRLFPGASGGEYVPGNMVALCVRCHREIHRELTPAPSAPTEDEIRATMPPGS